MYQNTPQDPALWCGERCGELAAAAGRDLAHAEAVGRRAGPARADRRAHERGRYLNIII